MKDIQITITVETNGQDYDINADVKTKNEGGVPTHVLVGIIEMTKTAIINKSSNINNS